MRRRGFCRNRSRHKLATQSTHALSESNFKMFIESAQPQIHRFLHTLWPERQLDSFARSCRSVRRVNQFQDRASVFAGNERFPVLTNAVDEVSKLLRVALVEGFFEDGE